MELLAWLLESGPTLLGAIETEAVRLKPGGVLSLETKLDKEVALDPSTETDCKDDIEVLTGNPISEFELLAIRVSK